MTYQMTGKEVSYEEAVKVFAGIKKFGFNVTVIEDNDEYGIYRADLDEIIEGQIAEFHFYRKENRAIIFADHWFN